MIYKTIKKETNFTVINKGSETIIIFHVFMREPVLQIWAEQFISGVEISELVVFSKWVENFLRGSFYRPQYERFKLDSLNLA